MLVKIDAKNVLKQNKLITRQQFAANYSIRFGTSAEKIKSQIKVLKQSFTCCFSEHGPIIFTTLWNKKPRFCWGEFALFINMYDLTLCKAVGGNSVIKFGTSNTALHPNIHTDISAWKKEYYKICLGSSVREVVATCLNSGELVLACEEVVYMLNRTSNADELYKFWGDILFSHCGSCRRSIDIGQRLCGPCSKLK
jgi:hypothetical protein